MEAETTKVDALEVACEDEDGAEWGVVYEGGHRKEDAISTLQPRCLGDVQDHELFTPAGLTRCRTQLWVAHCCLPA